MQIRVEDYLIDQAGIDWPRALQEWEWLLPPEFTVWLVNRFADLFLVFADGTVQMLQVSSGMLTKVAESRDEFAVLIDKGQNAEQWLMIPLVDRMVSAGITLAPQQCYGLKVPPILGGEYSPVNCAAIKIEDYVGACGSVHRQLRDVSDGSKVVLKIID